MPKNGQSIGRSMLWKASEKVLVQAMRLILEVVMARLLLPEDYGVYALLMTFVALSAIAVEGGLGTSLIQVDEMDDRDPFTVLVLSLSLALFLYCIVVLASGFIGSFYGIEGFQLYLAVMALALFPYALNSVQSSLLSRQMDFRSIFFANAISVGISGSIGLAMAFLGCGVWSLIIQYLSQITICCLVLKIRSSQRWVIRFSKNRAAVLFSFGWKLMASNFLNRGYGEIYNLVIGKAFATVTLGYFSKAKLFPSALENGLTSVVISVMMPVFSRMQHDSEKLKRSVRLCTRLLTFCVAPIFIGMAAACQSIVLLLLTETWVSIVPMMQILCFGLLFQPISHICITAINAIGESGTVLRLEIAKRLLGLVILIVSLPFGIESVALGLSLSYFINMLINCGRGRELLGYRYSELVADIVPSIAISVVMGVLVYALQMLLGDYSTCIVLALQVVVGFVVYVLLSLVLNRKVLVSFCDHVHSVVRSR